LHVRRRDRKGGGHFRAADVPGLNESSVQPYSGPESSCRTASPTKPRRSTTLGRALPERGIKDGRTGTMKFLARRPPGQPRRLGGGPVNIEAAMTTAWLCTACATSAEQPPSYPPGPDAYCTGCRCPLDAQERMPPPSRNSSAALDIGRCRRDRPAGWTRPRAFCRRPRTASTHPRRRCRPSRNSRSGSWRDT